MAFNLQTWNSPQPARLRGLSFVVSAKIQFFEYLSRTDQKWGIVSYCGGRYRQTPLKVERVCAGGGNS